MIARFRKLYGADPLHLLALVASFALAAAALLLLFDTGAQVNLLAWFLGAALLHDLVLWPLYTLLDRIAGGADWLARGDEWRELARREGRTVVPARNYIRVPAFLSGLMLLVYFPLILRVAQPEFEKTTGLDGSVYLGRWLWITGILCAGSAVLYAIRVRRARSGAQPADT